MSFRCDFLPFWPSLKFEAEKLLKNSVFLEDLLYKNQEKNLFKVFIKKSPYPVLVVGDFNDTPQSYTYAQIADNLQDAFAKKGFGLGITYGGIVPALRIDYILASPSLPILSHRIFKKEYSDHYPIVAELGIE